MRLSMVPLRYCLCKFVTKILRCGCQKVPTPWVSIMTSLPVWSILVAACAQCLGAFTLVSEMPTYLNGVMNFDIQSVGV